MKNQKNQFRQSFLLLVMATIIIFGAFNSTFAQKGDGGTAASLSSKLVGQWRLTSIVNKDGKAQDATAINSYNEYQADETVTETTDKGGNLESTDTGKYTVEGDRLTTVFSDGKRSWTNVETFRIDGEGKTLTLVNPVSTFVFKRV